MDEQPRRPAPLPEGFVLDTPTAPAPPAGFVLDAAQGDASAVSPYIPPQQEAALRANEYKQAEKIAIETGAVKRLQDMHGEELIWGRESRQAKIQEIADDLRRKPIRESREAFYKTPEGQKIEQARIRREEIQAEKESQPFYIRYPRQLWGGTVELGSNIASMLQVMSEETRSEREQYERGDAFLPPPYGTLGVAEEDLEPIEMPEKVDSNFITKSLQEYLEAHPELGPEEVDGVKDMILNPGKAVSAVARTIPYMAATTALTLAGRPDAAIALAFLSEGGAAYEGAIAEGRTPENARNIALTYAPIASAIEFAQVSRFAKFVKGKGAPRFLRNAFRNRLMNRPLLKKGAKVIATGLLTATEEAAEEVLQGAWQEYSTYKVTGEWQSEDIEEFVKARGIEAFIAALATIPMAGAPASVRAIVKKAKREVATETPPPQPAPLTESTPPDTTEPTSAPEGAETVVAPEGVEREVEPVAEAKPAKEVWEQTQAEYVAAGTASLRPKELTDKKWVAAFEGNQRITHRNKVKAALAAGKPVPAAVLAEYPDPKAPVKPKPVAAKPKEGKVSRVPRPAKSRLKLKDIGTQESPVELGGKDIGFREKGQWYVKEGEREWRAIGGIRNQKYYDLWERKMRKAAAPAEVKKGVEAAKAKAVAHWNENRLYVDARGNFRLSRAKDPLAQVWRGKGPIAPYNKTLKTAGITWEDIAGEKPKREVGMKMAAELVADYKKQGLDETKAWTEFSKDRNGSPEMRRDQFATLYQEIKAEKPRVISEEGEGFVADPTEPAGPTGGEPGFAAFGGEGRGKKVGKPWLTLDKTESPNDGIEDFFGRTNRLSSPRNKLRVAVARIRYELRRRFHYLHHIPDTPEAAFAKDAIRTMPEEARTANHDAIEDMIKIIDGEGNREALDAAGLNLLRRKIFTDDLIVEAERARAEGREMEARLPKGVTEKALLAERDRLDELIAKVPSVQDALGLRHDLWRRVSLDLAERGVISDEAAANEAYVRHFVLDYMEQSQFVGSAAGSGTGKRLKAPYRAYSKARKGTSRDISTDYLEVELKALMDIYKDNSIDDMAQAIATHYAVERTETGTIPEGYVEWQYKRGNVVYQAKTITESQVTKLVEDALSDADAADTLQIPLSAMRDGLVLGGKRKTHIIPDWLALQLDDLPVKHTTGKVASLTTPTTQMWKRWILRINPIRYNKRNMLGDSERVNGAGRTRAFLRVPEAVKRLINHSSPDAHPEAFEMGLRYGAFGSTLWHEMGSAHKLQEFERFEKVANRSSMDKAVRAALWPARKVSQAGQVVQDLTQGREDILRMAVYLDVLDEVDAHLETGKPIRHWLGSVEDIHALAKVDKYRAAAQIARETLGDYGKFTPWENDVLRNGIAPFYSWLKINTYFWPKAMHGAVAEALAKGDARGALGGAGTVAMHGGTVAAMSLGKWALRIGTPYAVLHLWNNGYGDEEEGEERRKVEEALPWWLKTRPHIVLKDGVIYEPSALSDFLEWFDLEEVAPELRRWERGQITYDELLLNVAKIEARAPVNRIVQTLSPFLKAPMNLAGMKTFPDVFEPRLFAQAFSSKAVEETVLNVLGADVKRFVDVGKGKRTLRDVLAYYFSGSAWRPLTAEKLEEEIRRSLKYTMLKSRAKSTGRWPGQAKKGREAELDDLLNRLDALGVPLIKVQDAADREVAIETLFNGKHDASLTAKLNQIASDNAGDPDAIKKLSSIAVQSVRDSMKNTMGVYTLNAQDELEHLRNLPRGQATASLEQRYGFAVTVDRVLPAYKKTFEQMIVGQVQNLSKNWKDTGSKLKKAQDAAYDRRACWYLDAAGIGEKEAMRLLSVHDKGDEMDEADAKKLDDKIGRMLDRLRAHRQSEWSIYEPPEKPVEQPQSMMPPIQQQPYLSAGGQATAQTPSQQPTPPAPLAGSSPQPQRLGDIQSAQFRGSARAKANLALMQGDVQAAENIAVTLEQSGFRVEAVKVRVCIAHSQFDFATARELVLQLT